MWSARRALHEMRTQPIAARAGSLIVSVFLLLIETYRLALRPFLIGSCKFHPTCSEYAARALQTHGPWHGARLAMGRLLRCHPFSPGGLDPVPEPDTPTQK